MGSGFWFRVQVQGSGSGSGFSDAESAPIGGVRGGTFRNFHDQCREIGPENGRPAICMVSGMAGVNRFEDLDAWKLSAQLRDEIRTALEAPNDRRDLDFGDQIRDSSASAPRNIAEGFGAFMPRENARFVRIARRSLMETLNHLFDGRKQGYIDRATADKLLKLNRRALGATTEFLKYLDSLKGKPPTGWSADHSNERIPPSAEPSDPAEPEANLEPNMTRTLNQNPEPEP